MMLTRSASFRSNVSGSSSLQIGVVGDSCQSVKEAIITYIDSVSSDQDLFDLGQYATLTRDNGVRPEALASLQNLITPLLVKNPTAKFRETDFKNGVAAALTDRPTRKLPSKLSRFELVKFIWSQVSHPSGPSQLVMVKNIIRWHNEF